MDSAREGVRWGGCQCGAIRFEATGEPIAVALCHCSRCRRANAAPAVAWAMFRQEQVAFVSGNVKQYNSSPPARRGFCADCGTQLTFTADFIPGLIDLTVGSFDHSEKLAPTFHYWESKRLPWMTIVDSLPRHAEFPPFD